MSTPGEKAHRDSSVLFPLPRDVHSLDVLPVSWNDVDDINPADDPVLLDVSITDVIGAHSASKSQAAVLDVLEVPPVPKQAPSGDSQRLGTIPDHLVEGVGKFVRLVELKESAGSHLEARALVRLPDFVRIAFAFFLLDPEHDAVKVIRLAFFTLFDPRRSK